MREEASSFWLMKEAGGAPFMSIPLPWLGGKEFLQLARPPVIVFRVRLRIALRGYIRPDFRVFSIQAQPTVETWLGIRLDRLRGTFRFTDSAVDTFVRVNNKHVFTFVEAIDRTDLNAVEVFALDAVLNHNISHISILATIPSSIGEGFSYSGRYGAA
jgi:hypothetical protein